MPATTVTFGEIMLRLTPPGFERLLQCPTLHATFGGGEANVAASLASLGLPAAYVTILPQANPLADAAIGELRRFGIDTSHIARSTGRMGIYFLETGASQRASRVVYDREGSAFALASVKIDWPRVFAGAGWFHVTGITPAVSQAAACLALEAARTARSMGITVSCDLNFRKNLWKWGKKASEVMPDLVKVSDVLIANEEDIQMALGVASDVDVHAGALDRSSYRGLTEAVLREYSYLRGIAVTLRESKSASHNVWSACLHDGKDFLLSRTYDIAHIVDRVGAGDSFAAGLIYGMQTNLGSQGALDFAVAASCLKHSVPGDINRVSLDEVKALLSGGGSGRVQR
ncbi:MAG: sugar kinase [Cyanobacteria bacterium]|nr:sugar kinase [Cyanobacteriota bacterium]